MLARAPSSGDRFTPAILPPASPGDSDSSPAGPVTCSACLHMPSGHARTRAPSFRRPFHAGDSSPALLGAGNPSPADSDSDSISIAQSNIAHSGNSFAYLTKSLPIGLWILDCGASDHISGNLSLFSTLVSPSTPSKLTLANGSQTQVKGIGNVCLLPSIPFSNVLFTPDCPYNLISVSKLTKDLHCSVIFAVESVVV
ncbi:uncharacterized protein LOC122721713 [Manihot esculenta]|uniref:uncharacterized protein LOC122721713 n=1 Tax=Manihot esculenta TaxID=3983 RepID=UPI001CC47BA3|nr:uncharacterized protein LOC122721713 [Manihot esculenta]